MEPIRQVVRRRLMYQPMIDAELKRLTKMLVTLGQFSGTGPGMSTEFNSFIANLLNAK